jgi:penicillin-binding protein 1A
VRQYAKAVIRRNYVLEEMAQNRHLSRAEADAAKERPLETIVGKERPQVLANARPSYFSQEVRRQLIGELGEAELYEGGLTIRATIDPELQELAARALRRGLEAYDRGRAVYRGPLTRIGPVTDGDTSEWRALLAKVEMARDIPGWHPAVVLDTGKTTALVGIEGLEGEGTARLKLATAKKWIKAIHRGDEKRGAPKRPSDLWQKGDVIFVAQAEDGPKAEGGWTLRQVPEVQGAFMTMDPFSGRVLAIQGGFSFEVSVFDRATQALRQPGSALEDWRPKNSSEKFYGPSPLRLGLELSRNLMTVRVAQQVGMDRVAHYAERFGVYEDMPYHLSYALGAGETTLYNMVAAYGMFANGGRRVRPTVVDRVQDRVGNTLFRHDPRFCQGCEAEDFSADNTPLLFDQRSQIMDPVTAYQLVSMMQGVVQRGTAARTVGDLGFPVAGKTGTTNEARDAWFIGFTRNMVAGCYIGYDNPTPMGRGAYGGTLCGPVFKEFISEAMKTRTPGEFREPTRGGMIMVKMDRETGERLPDDAIGAHVISELFLAGSEPELYGTVSAISGDDALFGGMTSDLTFGIDASDLPFDDAGSIQAPAPIDDSAAGDPPKPQPPISGGVGLGTGGLY